MRFKKFTAALLAGILMTFSMAGTSCTADKDSIDYTGKCLFGGIFLLLKITESR